MGIFSRRITGWDENASWCETPEPTGGCTYHGKDIKRSRLITGARIMRQSSKPSVQGFLWRNRESKGPGR